MRTSAAPALTIADDGEAQGVARVAGLVDDEDALAAGLGGRGAHDRRSLPHRLAAVAAAHHDRVKLAVENRGDHGARHDARGRDADDDLRVVFARDLERERARELAKERPLDLEDSLGRVDFVAAWHCASVSVGAESYAERRGSGATPARRVDLRRGPFLAARGVSHAIRATLLAVPQH